MRLAAGEEAEERNEGSLLIIRLVALAPLTFSGRHFLVYLQYTHCQNCLVVMPKYCDWTLNRIKVELRRRGARASGRKADLVER